ncbi:hypothetical protein NDU88_008249 [Pleurodeles waltl]|uniref:Uncharacterized protein n=1 Tax=Pleurodeles waltl TaxID=8319 RepID=A0AAV7N4E1_PLEWA|nr:hypothetical protein NDU88_008249 [Pleurodeles waltl]
MWYSRAGLCLLENLIQKCMSPEQKGGCRAANAFRGLSPRVRCADRRGEKFCKVRFLVSLAAACDVSQPASAWLGRLAWESRHQKAQLLTVTPSALSRSELRGWKRGGLGSDPPLRAQPPAGSEPAPTTLKRATKRTPYQRYHQGTRDLQPLPL